MIKPFRHIAAAITAIVLLTGGAADCHAQLFKKKKKEKETVTVEQVRPKPAPAQEGILEFIVEGNDTIYIDQIRASKIYSRLPKMKGREWRQYYRLVHNFSKAYLW